MADEKKTLKLFQKKKVIPKYVLPEDPIFDENDIRNKKKVDAFEAQLDSDIFSFSVEKRTKGEVIDAFLVDEATRGKFLGGDFEEFQKLEGKKKSDLFTKEDLDFDDTKVDDLGVISELITFKTEAPTWQPKTSYKQKTSSLFDEDDDIIEIKKQGEKINELQNKEVEELNFLKELDAERKNAIQSLQQWMAPNHQKMNHDNNNIIPITIEVDFLSEKFKQSEISNKNNVTKKADEEIALNSFDDINAYIQRQTSSSSKPRGLFD